MKIIFFILLFPCLLCAQTFEGQVQDAETKQAVAYVNIGVVGKNIGTVSNESGKFELSSSKAQATDTVQFSIIGYKSKMLTVKAFNTLCAKNCIIQLEKQAYDLTEIVVIPKDYKTKIVGNTSQNKSFSAGFEDNMLGYEMGVRMKIKKRPTYIEEVTLNIASCKYDSVFYRLNVYEMKGKKPKKNILKEPIYISYAKKDIGESIIIDLSDKNIYVEDDFLVSVELVTDLGKEGLHFCAGLFNNKTYFRETSQGKWDKIPVGISISAKIRQEE